jgi:hypothetical protein
MTYADLLERAAAAIPFGLRVPTDRHTVAANGVDHLWFDVVTISGYY